MEGKREQVSVEEIANLSRNETRDGVLVRVLCMAIAGPDDPHRAGSRGPRYEIYIEARGRSAVADLPAEERARLPARIDEIVGAFVDSLMLGPAVRAAAI